MSNNCTEPTHFKGLYESQHTFTPFFCLLNMVLQASLKKTARVDSGFFGTRQYPQEPTVVSSHSFLS